MQICFYYYYFSKSNLFLFSFPDSLTAEPVLFRPLQNFHCILVDYLSTWMYNGSSHLEIQSSSHLQDRMIRSALVDNTLATILLDAHLEYVNELEQSPKICSYFVHVFLNFCISHRSDLTSKNHGSV